MSPAGFINSEIGEAVGLAGKFKIPCLKRRAGVPVFRVAESGLVARGGLGTSSAWRL